MLEVSNVVKTFNRGTANERPALCSMSLDLATADFVVIIGSNGAGKSTLLNAVAGDFKLEGGTVTIDGVDVTALPTHARARWVARVFQDPLVGTAGPMTIEENLSLAAMRGDRRRFRFALTGARRAHFRDLLAMLGLGLEDRMTQKAELLSGGQRQSLALIMAIIKQPALLLLDEHCAALDPRTAAAVMEGTVRAVEEARLTTLMVTHNMQHAIDYGDRLVMLEAGRERLSLGADEKADLTVEALVERFHITDDKILLSG